MKVALDARYLASAVPRGMDRYTIGLARALSEAGIEVNLLCAASAPVHPTHRDALRLPILALRDRGGVYWEQVALPIALARGRFDVYHATSERGVPRLSPCPRVLTYHSATVPSYVDLVRRGCLRGPVSRYVGFDPASKPRTWGTRYFSRHIHHAERVITVSEFSRQEIVRLLGVPSDRVSVIPLAIDPLFLQPARSAAARDLTLHRLGVTQPFLLYVGGYERHKNVDGLIRAFGRIAQDRPALSLVLVGTGEPPAHLRALVEPTSSGLQGRVRFLSSLTEDLLDLYDGCTAFATFSWRETFCLPAYEAMARGKRVVASRIGALADQLDLPVELVDVDDLAAGAKALSSIASDRGTARMQKMRTPDWARVGTETLAIYHRANGLYRTTLGSDHTR